MKGPRLISIAAFVLLNVSAQEIPVSENELQGWRHLADLLPNDAATAFHSLPQSVPEERRAFARAITLLNAQPKTDGNIAAAAADFRKIIEANPTSDLAIASAFYLARIEHQHLSKPNPTQAATLYRQLLAKHAGHPFADAAAPKLAILLLYERTDGDERSKRIIELNSLLHKISDPAAKRDLHLILAGAFLRIERDHRQAIPHFLEALNGGAIERSGLRNYVVLQIAESFRKIGENAQAAAYYQKFLAEFPRDNRAFEINQRLVACLEAGGER